MSEQVARKEGVSYASTITLTFEEWAIIVAALRGIGGFPGMEDYLELSYRVEKLVPMLGEEFNA